MLGRVLGVVSAAVGLVAMTGCGIGTAASGGVATPMAIAGRTMGGQQPVSGATITLYRASTAGYTNASISEMTSSVITDTNGGFVLTSMYQCNSVDDLVYIVARNGNPGLAGGTNNSQIGLMAALGRCGDLTASTFININEVTTVAAAWALAQFMPSFDHLATSSTNVTGLKNSFGMAANLASVATGFSPGAAPADAVVPADKINTLANALAACVNSDGGVGACTTLMAAATPSGGTAPTNTIDAALNIARNPGTNVAAVYGLPTAAAPFQPALAIVPNDWTLAVSFKTGTTVASDFAIDASGNVGLVATDGSYGVSATGAQLAPGPYDGKAIAFDPFGNKWIARSGSAYIYRIAADQSSLANPITTTGPNVGAGSIAIDGTGNVWYTCPDCTQVRKLGTDGLEAAVSPVVGGSGVILSALSIDPSENVWVGNFTYSGFNILKPDATLYSSNTYSCGSDCGVSSFIANDHAGQGWFVGHNLTLVSSIGGSLTNIDPPSGGIFNPAAVAIDGAGSAWVANTNNILSLTPGAATTAGSISHFDGAGAALSPATGFSSPTLSTPQGIAVDGSGNVWLRNTGAATLTVFVGAATPVATPFSLALKNGKLGQMP